MPSLLTDLLPVKTIEKIQYRILSPEEIEKMSYKVVDDYTGVNNEIYKKGSAYDLDLGTISRKNNCATCLADYKTECGHYGHIKLVKPLFNTSFSVYIFKIFKCYCLNCGTFLIPPEFHREILKLDKTKRLTKCITMIKNRPCPACQNVNTTIRLAAPDKITVDITNESPEFLINVVRNNYKRDSESVTIPPEFILTRFKLISDHEIEVFGLSPKYSRPEWMILQNILLIPPPNRPIIQNIKGEKSEDNMFKLYANIIKYNNTLKTEIEAMTSPPTIETYQAGVNEKFLGNFTTLSFAVSSMMNDKMKKQIKVTIKGTNVQSVKDLIKGKTGWIRSHCMGKRVDFSARTVIGPEANFDVDEFGVPMYIAKILTFPSKVNQLNIDHLREFVMNGDETYPGASSIIMTIKGKSEKIILAKTPKERLKKYADDLKVGDIVNRHAIDGDYFIFNRQPSLHKYSFMGVRIKVMPPDYKIICVPFGSNKIFNADFDGDECQNHGPRSYTTANEIKSLMLLRNHIISFNTSDVQIGPLQDSVLAPYLMSINGHLLIDRKTYNTMLMASGYFDMDSVIPGKTLRVIDTVESLLPETLTVSGYGITVLNGKFTKVPFKELPQDMTLLGEHETPATAYKYPTITGKGIKESFIRTLFNDYNPTITNNLIAGMQKLSNYFLRVFGSTCSMRDVYLPPDMVSQLEKNILAAHDAVDKLLDEFDQGKIIAPITKTLKEYYEILVNDRVNPYLSTNMQMITDYLKVSPNNLYNMVVSGSKGSAVNITNMIDNIGQTVIGGGRIRKNLQYRSLVAYPKYCETLASGGFVSNCFSKGMTSTEFFFHQMGARDGLIKSVINVGDTGYANTRLLKSNEDVCCTYDNRIRRQSGQIVVELFGGNGIDPTWQTDNVLTLYDLSDEEFMREYF